MKQAFLGIAVSLCAACGSMAKAGPTTPAVVIPAGDVLFELGEMKLYDGADVVFAVHGDGSTEMGYRSGKDIVLKPGVAFSSKSLPMVLKPGPSMTVDGTFTHEGKPVVRANADGSFYSLKHRRTVPGVTVVNDTIRLEHAGTVVTLTMNADGTLGQQGGPSMSDRAMRIVGADTAGKRRAILSLVALILAPHERTPADRVEHEASGDVAPVQDIQPSSASR